MDVALEKLDDVEETVSVLNLNEMEIEIFCSRLSLLIDKLQHRKNFEQLMDWSSWSNKTVSVYPESPPVGEESLQSAEPRKRNRKATPKKREGDETPLVMDVKAEPNVVDTTADSILIDLYLKEQADEPEQSYSEQTEKGKKKPKRLTVSCKLCELIEAARTSHAEPRGKTWNVTTGSSFKLVPRLTAHVKKVHAEIVEKINLSKHPTNPTQDESKSLMIDETIDPTRDEISPSVEAEPLITGVEAEPLITGVEADPLMTGVEADQPEQSTNTKTKRVGLRCPLCDKYITNNQNNVRHMYCRMAFHIHKEHGEPMPLDITIFACSLCDFETLKSHGLQMHVESAHSTGDKLAGKTICTVCAKPIHKSNIQIHMLVSHNSSDVSEAVKRRLAAMPCPECGRKFRGSSGLERHRKTIHQQAKMHMCDLCSARFFAERDLNFHMFAMHNKINRNNMPVHSCTHCDYKTLCRRSLTIHLTSHSDVRPYQCEHCEKAFKTASSRLQHSRLAHEKSEIYKCELCDFSSHAKMKVARHKVIHNKVKRHRCTIPGCDYATHFQENLRKHLRKKTHDHSSTTRAPGQS